MKYKGVLIENISIFSSTAIYLELLLFLIRDHLKALAKLVADWAALIALLAAVWTAIAYLPALQVSRLPT